MPSNAPRKSLTSRRSWAPVSRSSSPKTVLLPAAITRRPKPAPGTGGPQQQPQRAPLDEAGDAGRGRRGSRARSARAGVSSTITSERALVDQLVQALDRHVVLRAGHRPRQVPVDAVLEDPLARLRRRAPPGSTSRSKVALASSWSAHSSPPSGPARAGHAARLVGQALHAQRGREAPRRVDRHHHHAGAAAREAAGRRRPTRSSCRRRRRRSRPPSAGPRRPDHGRPLRRDGVGQGGGERLERVEVEPAPHQLGQLEDRQAGALGQAPAVGRRRRAGRRGGAAPAAAALRRGAVGRRGERLERGRLVVAKRAVAHAVQHRRGDGHARARAAARPPRPPRTRRARRAGRRWRCRSPRGGSRPRGCGPPGRGWGRRRPAPRRCPPSPAGRCRGRWPGSRRRARPTPARRSSCSGDGVGPDLPDGHQLRQARGGGGEGVERAAAGQQLDQRAQPELARQVLLDRVLDVDRDPEEPGRQLGRLLVADARAAEQARQAVLAGRPR